MEFPEPLAQGRVDADRILPMRTADHKVIKIPHQIAFPTKLGLDGLREPQVEDIMEVDVTQEHTNRTALRGSLRARMHLSRFENADFPPPANEAQQPGVAHTVLHKAHHPLVVETPEEVL